MCIAARPLRFGTAKVDCKRGYEQKQAVDVSKGPTDAPISSFDESLPVHRLHTIEWNNEREYEQVSK